MSVNDKNMGGVLLDRIKPGIRLCFLLVGFGLFLSCNSKKSYRQQFEEELETNIEACMKPLVQLGMDSYQARSVCDCLLNTLFEIDSAMVAMDQDQIEQLFLTHEDQMIDCLRAEGLYQDEDYDIEYVEWEGIDSRE